MRCNFRGKFLKNGDNCQCSDSIKKKKFSMIFACRIVRGVVKFWCTQIIYTYIFPSPQFETLNLE